MENFVLKTPKKTETLSKNINPKRSSGNTRKLTGSLKKTAEKFGKSPQIPGSLEAEYNEAMEIYNDIKVAESIRKSLNFQDQKEFPSPKKDEDLDSGSGSSNEKENSLVKFNVSGYKRKSLNISKIPLYIRGSSRSPEFSSKVLKNHEESPKAATIAKKSPEFELASSNSEDSKESLFNGSEKSLNLSSDGSGSFWNFNSNETCIVKASVKESSENQSGEDLIKKSFEISSSLNLEESSPNLISSSVGDCIEKLFSKQADDSGDLEKLENLSDISMPADVGIIEDLSDLSLSDANNDEKMETFNILVPQNSPANETAKETIFDKEALKETLSRSLNEIKPKCEPRCLKLLHEIEDQLNGIIDHITKIEVKELEDNKNLVVSVERRKLGLFDNREIDFDLKFPIEIKSLKMIEDSPMKHEELSEETHENPSDFQRFCAAVSEKFKNHKFDLMILIAILFLIVFGSSTLVVKFLGVKEKSPSFT